MMTFAPASPSASAQASPMPCPAPVTRATRPPSLNLSRYIFLFLFTDCPSPPRSYHPTLLVEAVQATRFRRKPHAVAGFEIEFSDTARREHAHFTGVDIEEGIAAEMLGDRHRPGPAFALLADSQVFRPDAEGGDAGLAGSFSRHKIHLG